ncbi:MAG: hypothetical protein JXR76_26860 [Deltaproteobacteria bacterium]|nr:hypothetical protein [Deltaproteobacteria bacterium]
MKDKMEICASCGSIAPAGKYQCSRCHAPFEYNRIVVSPPKDELIYTRICGSFNCRRCGHNIALSYFTLDGFQCPECNSLERFDWSLWEDIVKDAHNVADLCGFDQPDAANHEFWQFLRDFTSEDLLRDLRAIGRNSSRLHKKNPNPHLAGYSVDLSPGNPVCSTCRTPLQIRVVDEVLQTYCFECKRKEPYEIVSGLEEYQFLFACIGQWHRAERSNEQSRPTLPFPEDASPWWMVFQGASPLRLKIERKIRRQEEETKRENLKAEKRKARAAERHRRMRSKVRNRAAVILLGVGIVTAVVTGAVLQFL